MGATDQAEDMNEAQDTVTQEDEERPVDRSHNRDILSSEAMTEMLRDLQDSMLALDERLGTVEAAHGHASVETRELAVGVAQMGDALARRVRALEGTAPSPTPAFFAPPLVKPVRPPPDHPIAWSAGMAFALALALAAFWLLRTESLDQAAVTPKPAPLVVAPAAPPPAASQPTEVKPPAKAPTTHSSGHSATFSRHSSTRPGPTQPAAPTNTPDPSKTPAAFGHYGPSVGTAAPPNPAH